MGNFLYPQGMAEAKRIQHAIDYLKENKAVSVSVLLIRQSHPGRDDSQLTGIHKGVPYKTIGHNMKRGWLLPLEWVSYVYSGLAYLLQHRSRVNRNIIYLYMEPNIENVLFIAFGRLLGYKVVVDVTEDYYFVSADPGLLSRLKAASSRLFSQHITVFADAIIVISRELYRKVSTYRQW